MIRLDELRELTENRVLELVLASLLHAPHFQQ